MEALGRLFNVVPLAAGEFVDLQDAEGITFICTGAATNSAATLTSSAAHGGGTPSNVQVTRKYVNAENDGSDTWSLEEFSANHVVPIGGNGVVYAIHVPAARLADGHRWVAATLNSGTAIAIVHDLAVQRDPSNLPQLTGD